MFNKNIYLVLMLIFTVHHSARAQSWSLGGAAIYGDDIKASGFHLRGYYNLPNDKICFGPEYSNFFEKSKTVHGEDITKSLSELNFNIHYIFEVGEHWGIYPLTGANLSFETEEITVGMVHTSEEVSKWGMNLGLGVHKPIGQWVVFGEFDHLFGDLSQNSFLLGVFITFGNKSKHKEGQ